MSAVMPLPPVSLPTCASAVHAQRGRWLALVLIALALCLFVLGTAVGSMGFENLLPALWNPQGDSAAHAMAQKIVWDIRLPRTLGAWVAGALLGLGGAVAQGLFRNPLADPYLLGSASGASLGVAIALALMGGGAGMLGGAQSAITVSVYSSHWLVRLGLTGAAFVGAVLAVLLTLALARGVQHTLRLLLAGVVVGVVLGALTSLILLLSPDFAGLHRLCRLDVVPADGRRVAAVLGGGLAAGARVGRPGAGRGHGAKPGAAAGAAARRAGGGTGAGHRHGRGADRFDRLCRPGSAAFGALRRVGAARALDAALQPDGWRVVGRS